MDRIKIGGITCQARLGTTRHERTNPQPIVVDLCLYLDLEEAGVRDELSATIDYVAV